MAAGNKSGHDGLSFALTLLADSADSTESKFAGCEKSVLEGLCRK